MSPVPTTSMIGYEDLIRIVVEAYDQTFYLHLRPNTDLFHPNAVLNINGKEERLRLHELRVYKGHVISEEFTDRRWLEDQAGVWRGSEYYNGDEDGPGVLGWARINIRTEEDENTTPVFEGVFQVMGETYTIKATKHYRLAKRAEDVDPDARHDHARMVVYRDVDTFLAPLHRREEDGTVEIAQCGLDKFLLDRASSTPPVWPHASMDILGAIPHTNGNDDGLYYMPFNGIIPPSSSELYSSLQKRAPPAGCPATKKINYMGAAADCTYTKYYQSSTAARTQIINDFNAVSALYERSFNIQLGLINITIMEGSCPATPSPSTAWNRDCSTSYGIESRLSDFSQWRGTFSSDGAGLWHLLTACASGQDVGLASVGTLCQTTARQSSSGSNTDTGVSAITLEEWLVVAHEIGHNFGAQHDCTAQTCPCTQGCQCCPLSSTQCDAGGAYIMNPSANTSSKDFSPCTINQVCSQIPKLGTCLEDPGSRTIKTLQMCGNGIKEDGEDCDTGGVNTTCCDGATCKFINNARCDDSTDLCCSGCQPRAAGYVCRPAASECDVEETCPGDSGNCPADVHKENGASCSNGRQCASGQCTSRDQQCRERGIGMDVTGSCSAAGTSCQVICSTRGGGLSCTGFNGYYVDGTPCGVGGTCQKGKCSLDNFGENVGNWIENHKQIAIPVFILVGLLILFCIIRCLFYGCFGYGRGYRSLGNKDGYVITTVSNAQPQPYYPPPPPHPIPQGWVDPAAYNGTPMAPPPTYTPGPAGPGQPPMPMTGQQVAGAREAYEMNPASSWREPPSSTPPVPPHSPTMGGKPPH
ncbi:Metallo-peptidase family M12-domain-containing protein [Dichotomocladium elegans]|nr:Metallo-peptidase family M12-domain-containing protein [Dichotomocladium elegans]